MIFKWVTFGWLEGCEVSHITFEYVTNYTSRQRQLFTAIVILIQVNEISPFDLLEGHKLATKGTIS